MDVIKQLNNAIAYIENNLCGEIDTNKIAKLPFAPMINSSAFSAI